MHFPDRLPVALDSFGVDVDDDALAAEFSSRLADEIGVFGGGRIDRNLVGAGVQQGSDVVERADAAPYGQRHEDHLGGPANHVEHDLTPLMAGRNVEEDQLVGTFSLVPAGNLDRIPRIPQIEKIRSFDDATAVNIEAWN